MLGVSQVAVHASYLGLPMNVGHAKVAAFRFIVDRMRRKTKGWKERHLSSAGKLVMLKAVVQAIPSFVMQCFELPKTLCDDMHGIMSRFWWGESQDGNRRIHWIAWNKLCGRKDAGGLGLRNMHQFNAALLAMQGWRIIRRPNSLLSKVLKAKYFLNTSFMQATLGSGASLTWRSIAAGRKVLDRGVRYQVDNGKDISVWGDKWLPIQYGFKPISRPPDGLESLKVCDLICHDTGSWKVDYMRGLLFQFEVEMISRLPISSTGLQDKLIWHHDKSGVYTVRGGYWAWRGCEEMVAASSSSDDMGGAWRNLWGLKIPEKVKVFCWKLLKNIIPTKSKLRDKHCSLDDDACPMCGMATETTEHVFRDCMVTLEFWKATNLQQQMKEAPKVSLQEWLWWLVNTLGHEDVELLCMCLWLIWNERNKVVWEHAEFNGAVMLSWLLHYLASYRKLHVREWTRKLNREKVKWECPPICRLKVNTDGAFRVEESTCGLGVIIRDEFGVGVAAIAKHVDIAGSVLYKEALALREGLRLCMTQNWQAIDVESDSIQLIVAMQRKEEDLSEVSPILIDCKTLASGFHSVSFRHVFREANSAADRLAQVACSNTRCGVWIGEMPEIIQDVLFEDRSTVSAFPQGFDATSP